MLKAVIEMAHEFYQMGNTLEQTRAWVAQNFGSLINVNEVMRSFS